IEHLVECFIPLVANAKAYAAFRKESVRVSSELHGAVGQMTRTQDMQKKSDVRFGQLRLEAAQETAWFGTRRLDLSAREFDVLYVLARHGGRPVSQEVLLRDVWGDQGLTRSNVIDVSINRLRRKLASQTSLDDLIQTIRGVGYKLDADSAAMVEASAGSRGGSAPDPRPPTPDPRQKGALLLEEVISLAIAAMLVPALLTALTTFVNNGDLYHDQVVALELGQAQVESVVKQPFQPSPASYSLISPLPDGYSLAVATGEATQYSYANNSVAPEVLQAITVTVTGRYRTLQVNGYRYRR
ncbi:MAG: winged helix-turn-helix domain-containing protein, partial [Dehalococcoidia bacterium]|nr:winged helix-turn-helix domain-containing protein [Dehalococcoidia bacterium]